MKEILELGTELLAEEKKLNQMKATIQSNLAVFDRIMEQDQKIHKEANAPLQE